MYSPELLQTLDFSLSRAKFDPPISPSEPGEALIVRPLCPADYDKGDKGICCLFNRSFLQRFIEPSFFKCYQRNDGHTV
jgi:hypothetical protein